MLSLHLCVCVHMREKGRRVQVITDTMEFVNFVLVRPKALAFFYFF